jgi:hypothetical protein
LPLSVYNTGHLFLYLGALLKNGMHKSYHSFAIRHSYSKMIVRTFENINPVEEDVNDCDYSF